MRFFHPFFFSRRRVHKTGLLTLLPAVILSGCAGFQDKPSCTTIDGLSGCQSLSDVHDMRLSGDIAADSNGHITRRYQSAEESDNIVTLSNRPLPINPPPRASTPLRVPERTAHVLVFPFVDSEGNYHDTTSVDLLLTPPRWEAPAATVIRHQRDEERL